MHISNRARNGNNSRSYILSGLFYQLEITVDCPRFAKARRKCIERDEFAIRDDCNALVPKQECTFAPKWGMFPHQHPFLPIGWRNIFYKALESSLLQT